MPNIIITAAKEAYPKYRNIPDDELTLRYAKEFPEYLEVDDFKADYDRITRKPVPVVATPKERAGAIESIGRRASGGLQGGLGGPLWKGVELGARLLGADDLAQYSKEVSAEAREYDRQQRLKSANTGVAGFLGDVAGAAPSLLPLLPAIAAAPLVGLARMTAAGIAAGATGGLSTFSDAEKAYYDKYKSEGMSDSEAESAARKSAAIPSIASGIATGTITRFMPVGGVESVTGLFGKGAAASAAGKAAGAEAGKRAVAAGLTEAGVAASIKAGVARQVGLAEARALVATSIPKAFIKGATNEAIEEGIDQIAQSAIQKLSYDPELTLKQAIDNVINAAMVGGALGGSIQAAVQPSARKGAEAAIRQDKIYNELRVQAEAEAKSDATRREDRLEDEMRREKELKALDRTAAENLEAAHAAQQKQRDAQALADKTLIDTLNEKERIEAEAKLTASQQSAVTAIRDLAGKTVGAKITDVTPEGYGPKAPPAATGATGQHPKLAGLNWARENIPWGERGTTTPELRHKIATALRDAGFRNRVEAEEMSLGEKPFPTREKFEQSVDGNLTLDAMQLLSKVESELRDVGLNPREATLPKREDFKTAEEFWKAAYDIDGKMRATGASAFAGLVRTGQVAGFTKPAPPAATGATAQKPGMSFNEFKKAYETAFQNSNKYTPDEVGSKHYTDQMAELADAHPEWVDLVENPQTPPPLSEGLYKAKNEEGRAYKIAQGFVWNGEDWIHPDYIGKSLDVPQPKATDVRRELEKLRSTPAQPVVKPAPPAQPAQAQADIKAVTDRILVMIGRKVLPKNVKVVYQPESNFAAYYQSGEIIINAARIVNVEAVLVEEAVHAVWADPELQAAWDTVKKTVTIQDIDEQRLRAAADKRYPDNAELREEAAVAKLVRHRTPAIKGFLMAIRKAIAKAFGFHVKLSDIELIQNAAMSKLTTDSKAVQISPPAEAGAAPVVATTRDASKPEQMTHREVNAGRKGGFGKSVKTDGSGRIVDLRADVKVGDYVTGAFFNGHFNEIHSGKVVKVSKSKLTVSPISGGDNVALDSRIAVHSYKEAVLLKDYEGHAASVNAAIRENKPVSADAADAYGIKLPDGYVKNWDMYVFNALPQVGSEVKSAEVRPASGPQEQAQPPAQATPVMQEGMDNLRFTSDPVKTTKQGGADAEDAKSKLIAELEKAVKQAPAMTEAQTVALKELRERMDGQGKDRKMRIDAALASMEGAGLRKVTIEIPGDGTFTVWNTKENLTELLRRAKRLKTASSTEAPKRYPKLSEADREWVQEQLRNAQPAPPAATGAAQKVAVEPAIGVGKVLEIPASSTKAERKAFENIQRDIALIKDYGPKEMQRESRARRKSIERADISMRRAAEVLGLELPRRSTFYNPESDLANANKLEAELRDLFGKTQPTPAATEAAGQKMPWEMTLKDFQNNQNVVKVGNRQAYYSGIGGAEATRINAIIDAAHRKSVVGAANSGKPVSLEVAAAYPEILAKLEATRPKQEVLDYYTKAASKARLKADEIQARWDNPGEGITPMFQRVKFLKRKAAELESKVESLKSDLTPSKQMTPMQRQYRALKEKYPNEVVLIRLGDFYEAFWEDAEKLSKDARVTLTKRQDVPMAGVPYHSVDSYVAKMEAAGHKVKLVEDYRTEAAPTLKPTPAATGATGQKMPWEMTRDSVKQRSTSEVTAIASERDRRMLERRKAYEDERTKLTKQRTAAYRRISRLNPADNINSIDSASQRIVQELQAKIKEMDKALHELSPPNQSKIFDEVASERGYDRSRNELAEHRKAVERAIREGKPVPESVLADYPDLKPTPPDAPRYAAAERDASDQPAFYSRLNRAVEQTTQNKASGAQWKATIKNSKLGTNADEYELVGVGDLEDGKTYTKQEVLDYLKANEVVVKDVTLGSSQLNLKFNKEETAHLGTGEEMFDVVGENGLVRYTGGKRDAMTYIEEDAQTGQRATRFSTHQLPGAVEGSYRERLLTVPERVGGDVNKFAQDAFGKPYAELNDSEKRATKIQLQQDTSWRDGHELYSSFANPIVRGRTNERLIPIESLRESNPDVYARVKADGRTHALMVFVEENQLPLGARWHEVNGVKFEGGGSFERASAYAKEHGGKVEKKYSGELAKMPALFRDNGYAIGLKYGLRYAVERNADLYGWTTGEQQAARYDLSKQVKSVTWNEGNKEFSAVPISDGDTISRSGVEAVDLSGIVGKDVAQKLIEATANRFGNRRLEGLDLKVGGEGLKKLYDVEFRNIINNLPAVKKSGQKVGVADISLPSKQTIAERDIRNYMASIGVRPGDPRTATLYQTDPTFRQLRDAVDADKTPAPEVVNIHSLAITPAIRDAVMGGQARFAASERGAGSELGALQGGVDGVDYLNWADRFRTNFITKYAPITKMERVLRESAGMGRAEFGMERWFERLAGVAGIAKASIIEMRMELDPLVAGDEKAFNNYIFWQYIERRSTLRAQALADVASARAMVANGTATDADRASIASNNKLADQMEFAGYDNPTVAKKNLNSIRANLAKSGALEDMDKAVAIYVKHTNLALDNIVDSGYLAQDRIDKYRSQFPVYIPIINLQIPDSKNGYQVTKGRVGISDPNFKSKNPLDAFDEYIFRMHAKAEVNKAKRRIYNLAVKSNRPDIARVEHDRLHSTESGFSLRVNGVDTMVVAHPEVVAAVNSFSDTASNTLNDFLRKANSVLKFGATSASLAFQVRNLFLGDLPTLALMSKAGITNPINAVTFVIDVITSFAQNFRASAYGEYSPLMLEFMKSGAMGSSMHSSIDSLGRDTQTGASSEGKISQYVIDAFGKMSNTIEQTSKLAGFKRLMDKAGVKTLAELNDPIKQMALVAEVRNYCGSPDFARNGSVMGLAMIRLGFVFVNPAMAGNASALERLTANLNKNSSDSDKKAALTAQIRLGFTVGLATMISYALRSQDDEAEESYDGLDKKSKEDNFHLVTDKYDVDIEGNKVRRFVKIPKRGVIKIVANTMEAYLDYSRAKDPEDFTRMMGRVLEEVIPLDIKGDTLEERIQGTMASVNPAIRVPIEYATGMSFYSRQPTVPRSMRGAANSEQYRERTNENIKMLAGVFGVSPLKFKQALDNATGGLTRTLLPEKESELNVDSPINIPLVKGYLSPTYRESEDKEYISELRKEADTATVVRTRAAVAFMKSMEGKTIKETYQTAAAKYARTQPELFDRIDDLIDQKMSGATIEDRHITSLPNAQRAKIVMARLQKLPVGERREAVKVLYRKKVISDATADEMLKAGYNFRQ